MPGERNGKEEMEHTVYRRLLSAVCAIALAFTAVCPAVAAAPEETTGTPQTLTASEVKEMQQTDAAVTALTDISRDALELSLGLVRVCIR